MDEKYIEAFVKGLRETIEHNEKRGKGDEWKEMKLGRLFERLSDEKRELAIEMNEDFRSSNRIAAEALDVALVSMFIYLVASGEV